MWLSSQLYLVKDLTFYEGPRFIQTFQTAFKSITVGHFYCCDFLEINWGHTGYIMFIRYLSKCIVSGFLAAILASWGTKGVGIISPVINLSETDKTAQNLIRPFLRDSHTTACGLQVCWYVLHGLDA